MTQRALGFASLATRSASEEAPVAPSLTSACTASVERSKTTEVWPFFIRRRTMFAPILPSPIIPSCIGRVLLRRPSTTASRRLGYVRPRERPVDAKKSAGRAVDDRHPPFGRAGLDGSRSLASRGQVRHAAEGRNVLRVSTGQRERHGFAPIAAQKADPFEGRRGATGVASRGCGSPKAGGDRGASHAIDREIEPPARRPSADARDRDARLNEVDVSPQLGLRKELDAPLADIVPVLAGRRAAGRELESSFVALDAHRGVAHARRRGVGLPPL